MLTAADLKVEYKANPIGMDEPVPRFFYRAEGSSREQTARQIRVQKENGDIVWDSGWVDSSSTIQIEYEGTPLQAFTRYEWSVRIRDEHNRAGAWSKSAFFETGFLGTKWNAKWIAFSPFTESHSSVAGFRRSFSSGKKIVRARLYASALGLYRAFLNGDEVDSDCMKPGWTDYHKRVQYQAFDVTDRVRKGKNLLAFELADGWYNGRISHLWNSQDRTFGPCTALIAELHLSYADGTQEIIATDKTFEKFPFLSLQYSMTRYSDIYTGEYFISRRDGHEWRSTEKPGEKKEYAVELEKQPEIALVWQSGAPVRHMQDLEPVRITRRKNGNWIVDFGQNLSGREKLFLKNIVSGTCITIRHGEMLQDDGALYTANLRSALATTVYICQCDRKEETYEPQYTYYGFRYLEISGWPGVLTKKSLVARILYSDLPQTGSFSCSEKLLNQLYRNILWGQRSNFLDVPTDCPQRDERYGWTGDTQVFANMATYNMYAPEFYTKWITDLNLGRSEDGIYGHIAPNPYASITCGATGWGDAGVVCPWVMFTKYADTRLLEMYYDNICSWLDWQVRNAGGKYIVRNALFGDWLNIDSPTPEDLLSTAYLCGMNRIAAQIASVLGRDSEAEQRMAIHEKIGRAFTRKFYTSSGELKVRTQTAALMALAFDCIPEKFVEKTLSFLVHDIRISKKLHLSTGFLGTPLLLNVLSSFGETDLAYDLLLQTTYPGWLYPITQGATTMWERWNSYTKDSGFGDVTMNSFNHYAYGAVGEWFFETICGIKPLNCGADAAAFRQFLLAPQPGKRLTEASASLQTFHGEIRSAWKRTGKEFVWNFTVPCNTLAVVIPPFEQDLPETEGLEKVKDGYYTAAPGKYRLAFRLSGKK